MVGRGKVEGALPMHSGPGLAPPPGDPLRSPGRKATAGADGPLAGRGRAGPEMTARLVEHRRRMPWTQRELAEIAGVSVGTIRSIEQGARRTLRPRTMRSIAAALGVPPGEVAEFRAALGLPPGGAVRGPGGAGARANRARSGSRARARSATLPGPPGPPSRP